MSSISTNRNSQRFPGIGRFGLAMVAVLGCLAGSADAVAEVSGGVYAHGKVGLDGILLSGFNTIGSGWNAEEERYEVEFPDPIGDYGTAIVTPDYLECPGAWDETLRAETVGHFLVVEAVRGDEFARCGFYFVVYDHAYSPSRGIAASAFGRVTESASLYPDSHNVHSVERTGEGSYRILLDRMQLDMSQDTVVATLSANDGSCDPTRTALKVLSFGFEGFSDSFTIAIYAWSDSGEWVFKDCGFQFVVYEGPDGPRAGVRFYAESHGSVDVYLGYRLSEGSDGVEDVTWNPNDRRWYVVTTDGHGTNDVAVASLASSGHKPCVSIATGRSGNRLIVQTLDSDGNGRPCSFRFATYQGPRCGLGAELAVLMPAVEWLRRRKRGRTSKSPGPEPGRAYAGRDAARRRTDG